MYSRKYIIGPRDATECPWCAMPLGNTDWAIEIVSEHPDKDCIQEGFCCYTCAKLWVDDIKEKLIKVVDNWVAGERPIIDHLPAAAKIMIDDARGTRH